MVFAVRIGATDERCVMSGVRCAVCPCTRLLPCARLLVLHLLAEHQQRALD
jgi:hypothetical protein